MSKRYFIYAILFLSLSLIFTGNALHASAEENENTICQGVFIDEVDVSGMNKEEAEAAVNDFVADLQSRGIAIKVGKEIVYFTMGEIGYTYQPNNNIEEALGFGKTGNLIKRYKDLKDIEQGNVVLPLVFIFDESKVEEIVSKQVSAYNVAPINASVKRVNGEFIYTDHVVGKKVNEAKTTQLIIDAIKGWNRQDLILEAIIEDDMPIYTRDVVEKCNTVLGEFTTDYSTSASGRAANLENGARLINNLVLYPGDVFSAYEVLTPFTEENGYSIAGAYLNGLVVDSVGGGACQVTTTLYNAVLNAELEVVERQPHSMTISYVDLSRDAAIAGTYKDFKFKNNTDVPIVIEGITRNRKITFKIWGHETRDTVNRKIEFETKILSEKKPPKDVITEDPTKPKTYRKVTQTAHVGYKTELYKVVYENGKEVSRTLVNTSNYQATPQYVTVGTKEVEEEKTDTSDSESKDEKSDSPTGGQAVIDGGEVNESQNESQSDNSSTDDLDISEFWDPAWDLEEPVE